MPANHQERCGYPADQGDGERREGEQARETETAGQEEVDDAYGEAAV